MAKPFALPYDKKLPLKGDLVTSDQWLVTDHWQYNTPQPHFVRQLPFRGSLWQSGRMNALRQRVLQKSRIFCINFVRMYKISATYLDNLTKQ